MPVIKDDGGTIMSSFSLEPGISDQHIAVDILKQEGFSPEVLAMIDCITSV